MKSKKGLSSAIFFVIITLLTPVYAQAFVETIATAVVGIATQVVAPNMIAGALDKKNEEKKQPDKKNEEKKQPELTSAQKIDGVREYYTDIRKDWTTDKVQIGEALRIINLDNSFIITYQGKVNDKDAVIVAAIGLTSDNILYWQDGTKLPIAQYNGLTPYELGVIMDEDGKIFSKSEMKALKRISSKDVIAANTQ